MKRLIVLLFAALFVFYVAWPAYSGYQIHQALAAKDTATLANKIDFKSVRASMREPVLAHVEDRMTSTIGSYGPLASLVGTKIPKGKVSGLVDGALADVVNPEGLVRIYGSGADVGAEVQRSILKQIDKMGGFLALFRGGRKPAAKSAGTSVESGGSSSGFGGLGDLAGGVKLPGGLDKVLGGGASGAVVGAVTDQVMGQIDAKKLAEKLFPALIGGGRRGSGGASSDGSGGGSSGFGLGNVKDFGFAGPLGLRLGVAQSASASDSDVTAQINFQDFDWKVTKLTPNL